MEDQHLSDMLSPHQRLLTEWQTEQLKLAQKHEEESLRLVEEARENQLRLARDQKFELQKKQLNKWMQAESVFRKVAKKDSRKDNPKSFLNRVNNLTKDYDYQLSKANDQLSEANDQLSEANDELSEARKMAAEMVQAVDSTEAKRLIGEARRNKGLGRLKPPVIRFKMMGSIDHTPWAAAFKRKSKSGDDWEMEMKEELTKWEGIVRNPQFQPFKTVDMEDGKWEQVIDHENEELSCLKKKYGIRVYYSVTTALMELKEYNSSGRYPVPSAWNFKESRIATLKEVFSHLAPVIEAFVGRLSPQGIGHDIQEQQASKNSERTQTSSESESEEWMWGAV